MNTQALQKRMNRMKKDIDKRLSPVTIEFITYWGDEIFEVEKGDIVFRTEWGGGILEGDEEVE